MQPGFLFCKQISLQIVINETLIVMEKNKEKDPCWKNYEQVGMKQKEGKAVPNCVPKKKKSSGATKKAKSA